MIRKFLIILEIVILVVGAILSFWGAAQATAYSDSYKIYYLGGVLGLMFAGFLEFKRKKKYAFLMGIAMIFIYFIGAGLGFVDCYTYADHMSFLKNYEGKEITIRFEGDTYEWKGETFFHVVGDHREVILDGEENFCEINGEKQKIYQVRIRDNEPDLLYCPMYPGFMKTNNLIFVKCKDYELIH